MSNVEPRTRREFVREVIASVVVSIVAVTPFVALRSGWALAVKITVIIAVYAVVGLGIGLLLRRQRRAGRVLDRSQQRVLQRALRGTARLPDSADESWRPVLRNAVIGNSVWSYLVFYGAFFAYITISSSSGDDPDDGLGSPIVVVIVVVAVGALVVMLSGFLSWVSRLHADNAMAMLDQLDARAAKRADA